ncbi:circumsporozoite protein-like [Helianthus annuus]|uniref:circumsporozoite protein-like n=1 Tax=Helianthus annuus TaxID=4232 RepID=UPI000B8FB5DB|nr:circumsporozoite protein-like [Helianthus annuus]
MDPPPPPTTGEPIPPFIPLSTQPSPNTTMPNTTTDPTPPHDVPPPNTTPPITTQVQPTLTFNPSTTIPSFSHFFPALGQSSSTYPLPQSSTVIHATSSFRPPNKLGFQYSCFPFGQSSGIGGYGYEEGYEEFEGYEEDGFYYEGDGGNLGPQGEVGQQM